MNIKGPDKNITPRADDLMVYKDKEDETALIHEAVLLTPSSARPVTATKPNQPDKEEEEEPEEDYSSGILSEKELAYWRGKLPNKEKEPEEVDYSSGLLTENELAHLRGKLGISEGRAQQGTDSYNYGARQSTDAGNMVPFRLANVLGEP